MTAPLSDDPATTAKHLVHEALIANNGPQDRDEMPYPASLRPIAEAVVAALSDAGLLRRRDDNPENRCPNPAAHVQVRR